MLQEIIERLEKLPKLRKDIGDNNSSHVVLRESINKYTKLKAEAESETGLNRIPASHRADSEYTFIAGILWGLWCTEFINSNEREKAFDELENI